MYTLYVNLKPTVLFKYLIKHILTGSLENFMYQGACAFLKWNTCNKGCHTKQSLLVALCGDQAKLMELAKM